MFLGLVLTALSGVAVLSFVLYPKVRLSWLQKVAWLLVLSFPLERIPSLDTALGTLKVSHLLVAAGYYFLALLILKKDRKLLSVKVHPVTWWVFGFYVFSAPGIYFVQNFNRFLVVYVAVFLSFSTLLFITHFLQDSFRVLCALLAMNILILFFSIYQFIADMAGLPATVSTVKPLFQKHVFGIPRLHATFNEPSYFANGLILPVVGYLILLARKIPIARELPGLQKKGGYLLDQKFYAGTYALLLLLFAAAFVLTLAKSAWLVAPVILVPLHIWLIAKGYLPGFFVRVLTTGGIVSLLVIFFLAPLPGNFVNETYTHALKTLSGRSATVAERSIYFQAAADHIAKRPLTGIGPGQFGTVAGDNINFRFEQIRDYALQQEQLRRNNKEVIVFNVYAEVWLEYGLGGFIAFLGIVLYALLLVGKGLWRTTLPAMTRAQLTLLICGLYLAFSLLQWNYISPLYVNPIFIALGLIFNTAHYART